MGSNFAKYSSLQHDKQIKIFIKEEKERKKKRELQNETRNEQNNNKAINFSFGIAKLNYSFNMYEIL